MNRRLETLLLRAAHTRPHAPAVRVGRSVYSYQDIHDRANQLGCVLQRIGAARGDRIGIWMEKSAASVAAMQAVLRVGACYVPLDPLASLARTQQVIRDADLRAIVTTIDRKQRGLDVDLRYIPLIAMRTRGSEPSASAFS